MAGKWNRNKTKKPLETSLGRAPRDADKGPDLSHLRKPITTSVSGLKQVLALFQTATAEVQEYITYECDVLYECRICRTIFRSLANFILHKRNYCQGKFTLGGHIQGDDPKTSDDDSRCPSPEASKTDVQEDNNVLLEKIDTSEVAVFQTCVQDGGTDFMKSEVMEIHGILDNNEAVVGSDGTIEAGDSKPKTLVCTECNYTFSTEKTLNHHVKYKHNKTCIVYPCPDCKETFSNAWSVYRHLFKVHRRTAAQVRRMRPMIHSSGIPKDQEPEKKKPEKVVESEDNQWMRNLESDKDFQRCGGCGKRFERKAALQSHSQMCTKRIAVCNTIKNKKKDKPETKTKELTGAARRKRSVLAIQKVIIDSVDDVEEKDVIEEADPLMINSDEANSIAFNDFASDITITKDSQTVSEPTSQHLPEMEIFTISDDSNESEAAARKRKSYESDQTVEIPDEFKEFLHDEIDNCFVAKALPYMDSGAFKCSPCASGHVSLNRLLRHMSLHFSWFRFQCSKCAFLSFNKYDCTNHALSHHSTPTDMIASTVLPIPKWKVLCTSHDFKQVTQEMDSQMPELIEEKTDSESGGQPHETIVLEDDEMPDITAETVVLSDDDANSGVKFKAGPSRLANSRHSRPIRNRTKSVKTVQNDFIYDLAKVLKLNDNSIKGSRTKRSLNKS